MSWQHAMDILSRDKPEDRPQDILCPVIPDLPYKRPFDLILTCFLLVPSLPVALLVAILVKLTSPGPILFRHERLGRGGQPFTMYKFRTMYHNLDSAPHYEYFKQYLHGAPAPGQKGQVYKLWNDPRITPYGGLLRRLALDELPQLINVLKGDMSLVGPRPPLAYEVQHYEERHLLRLSVRPGITGLWQIQGRDLVTFEEMVRMDLDYIERHSLTLDLKLLLLTVPKLVVTYIRRR